MSSYPGDSIISPVPGAMLSTPPHVAENKFRVVKENVIKRVILIMIEKYEVLFLPFRLIIAY